MAIAGMLAARVAGANGRFPNAQQLRELAPSKLVVAGTYGLLVSGNAGKDFSYVCESELFGKTTMGSWVDPLLESLPDGSLVTGSHDLARRTSDLGCSFAAIWSLPHNPEFLPPEAGATGGNGNVVDVCPTYDSKGGVLALASIRAEDKSILEHRLYKSTDGVAWTAVGKAIPITTMNLALTLDVAPGRPQRIYVSGSLKAASVLVVTDDGGETWSAVDIPLDDEALVDGVYIAGVSPTDPQRVYLRAQREGLADDGASTWDDSLIVSEDGGKNFRDVLRRKGSLMGFALSPDGKTVAAGFGDPMVAPLVTTDTDLGIYGASASDLIFTQTLPLLPVSCLRWTSSALYVCARDDDPLGTATSAAPQFHIGIYRGTGLPTAAIDVKPLLKLKDVHGPLPWADKRVSACAAEWIDGDPSNPTGGSVCAAFNACTAGGMTAPGADALVCGAATSTGGAGGATSGSGGANPSGGGGGAINGGSSASGGSSAKGGANPSGGSAGAASSSGGASPSSGGAANAGQGGSSSASSGCGCELARRRGAGESFGLLLLALGALRRRRRDVRKPTAQPQR
jgi:hypothetical protein